MQLCHLCYTQRILATCQLPERNSWPRGLKKSDTKRSPSYAQDSYLRRRRAYGLEQDTVCVKDANKGAG